MVAAVKRVPENEISARAFASGVAGSPAPGPARVWGVLLSLWQQQVYPKLTSSGNYSQAAGSAASSRTRSGSLAVATSPTVTSSRICRSLARSAIHTSWSAAAAPR